VHVAGARVVGRDLGGHMVLDVSQPKEGRAARISLSPADSAPVLLGRVLALLALAYLVVGLVAVVAWRSRMRRRRGG
jgi:hypothetical protein